MSGGIDELLDGATSSASSSSSGATAPASTRRSWWHRNRLSLLALVLIAPLTVTVLFWGEYDTYFGVRPSRAVPVAADTTAVYGGAEWTVTSVRRVGAGDAGVRPGAIPDGADAILVAVEIEPEAENAPACTLRLHETRASGGDRSTSAELGARVFADDPLGVSGCSSDETTTYTATAAFFVPADARGDMSLDVIAGDELPRFLRMRLSD
ncbi:MAG: hypothetical protein ABW040_05220 [Microbacteriaceae bacterium]